MEPMRHFRNNENTLVSELKGSTLNGGENFLREVFHQFGALEILISQTGYSNIITIINFFESKPVAVGKH